MADIDQTADAGAPAPPPFDPTKPFTVIAPPSASAAVPPPFDPAKPYQVLSGATPPAAPSYTQQSPLVPAAQRDIEAAPSGSWIQTPKGLMQKPEAPKAPEPSSALDYSGLIPGQQPPSAVKSFIRGAETGVGGAAGGLVGFGTGAALGAEVGAFGGPVAGVTVPAGALIGGIAGSFGGGWLGDKAQEKVVSLLPPSAQEAIGQSPEQISEAQQAHQYMFGAGAIAPSLLAFTPLSAGDTAVEGAVTIQRLIANEVTARAVPAAIMAAQDVVQRKIEGEPVDAGSLGLAAGAGLLMRRDNALGRWLIGMGIRPVNAVFGHVPGAPEAISQAAQQPAPPADASPQVGETLGMPIGGVTHPMTVSAVTQQGDVTLTDRNGTNYTMPGAQVARLRTEVPNAPSPQAASTPAAAEALAAQGTQGASPQGPVPPATAAPGIEPIPTRPEDFRPKDEPALDNLKQVAANLSGARPPGTPTPDVRTSEAVQQLQQEAAQPGLIAPTSNMAGAPVGEPVETPTSFARVPQIEPNPGLTAPNENVPRDGGQTLAPLPGLVEPSVGTSGEVPVQPADPNIALASAPLVPEAGAPTPGIRPPEAVTADVEAARGKTNQEPSAAQAAAGNYAKGKVDFHGLPFVMENPVGTVRRGIDEAGQPWESTLPADYGYISKTEGADGDHVDAYMGPDHDSQKVFVIDQFHPGDGGWDEHKAMLGFRNWPEARETYLDAFSDDSGESRLGNATPMSLDEFKSWLKEGDTKNPIGQQALALNSAEARTPVAEHDHPQLAIADQVASRLERGPPISAKELQQIAEGAYGNTMASGRFDRSHIYDALELGVNRYVRAHSDDFDPSLPLENAQRAVAALDKLKRELPTQTVRAGEKDLMQQFSTPPDYGYAAAWLANIEPGQDRVIEPSAGTGSMVAPAMNARPAEIIVNELSNNRAPLVESLGPNRAFRENAEQLHNILPDDVKPSVVLMNPPFSSAGERMAGRKQIDIGAQHVEQALQRLQPGGRLVAIVGRGMRPYDPEAPLRFGEGSGAAFREWWDRIGQQYDVRANVGVPGDVYTKYGTNFSTRTLIIDKNPPSGRVPVIAEARDIPDLMNKLAEVRNDRQSIRESGQPLAGEPGREEVPRGGESPVGASLAVRPATGEPGIREGSAGARAGAGVSSGAGERGAANARPDDQGRADNAVVSEQPEQRQPSGAERLDAAPVGEGVQLAGSSTGPDGVVLRPAGSAGSILPAGDSEAALVAEPTEAVRIDQAAVEPQGGELTDNVYEPYRPQRTNVTGAQEHPGALVQSAAMASVLPPHAEYAPQIPQGLIDKGALSDAQLEAITYAGNAHGQMLPGFAGETPLRRGYFVGDGTGVGKGREVAGIILDNWTQGRQKAVWISEKRPLINDAQRDWSGLGQDKKVIFDLSKTKPGDALGASKGVAFLTYDTLKSTERTGKDAAGKTIKGKRRLDQLVDWLGNDFDGVIAFDEAHNMANSIAMKGKRGIQDAAEKALAGVELQEKLPNARIVYVSATGATEVSNLAYAERLGLWGRGTAFPNKAAFISQIHSGGIAAMELVARDMKAMGSYIARNLSYDGVEYDRIEHALSPQQKQIYDDLAGGWQTVLQNMNAALAKTGGDKSQSAKSGALSAFWSGHQRFFNQVITSMQMPSVLRAVETDLAEGKQAVLQLVNTNEAAQKRALSKVDNDEQLEQLDLTPRDQLMQLIEHSFPVTQHEMYIDENGNERSRPVTDSAGNVVQNREAVAMREALLDKLGGIRVPDGPLEMLINHFGVDKVAEVTGRKQRVVRNTDDQGNSRTQVESRPGSANVTEADAFQNGKKPILVFSEAGGTGRSYHADNTSPSAGARRSHYLVQAGWRADKAIQGFGRTHRTNQASAPTFHLVTTDLQGQRRFISSIARRLSQLGALTKGERRAGEQGMFSARDNLESTEASEALYSFFRDLYFGKVPEISMREFENQTGLALTDNQGNLKRDLPPIPQFLNRLLSLKYDMQNSVFGAFEQRLNDAVDRAAAAGTLDVGTETLRGDRITKDEDRVVHTDPQSGAQTRYVRLKVDTRAQPASFDQVINGERLTGGRKPVAFAVSKQSGKVYAISEAHDLTDTRTGNVTPQYRLTDPMGYRFSERSKIDGAGARQFWEKVPNEAQARALWEKQVGAIPEYVSRDVHMITGAILPIWDRVSGTPKVFRTQTTAGERILGRQVDEKNISQTLRALNAEGAMKAFAPAEVAQRVMGGEGARLANGWSLKRSLVAGEPRLEIVGPDYYAGAELERDGAFKERIGYTTRFFIPTGEKMGEVLGRIIERRPVTELTGSEGFAEPGTFSEARANQGQYAYQDLRDDFGSYAERIGAAADPHQISRDWTVRNGRDTGNEHLVAVDTRAGAVGHAYTYGKPSFIDFSPELLAQIQNPDESVVVHHNHPSDNSLSPQDVKQLGKPGLSAVVAHGHGGDTFAARLTPETAVLNRATGAGENMLAGAYSRAANRVYARLNGLVDQGKLSLAEADRIYPDLINRALDGAGITNYMSSRDVAPLPVFWAKGVIREAATAARNYAENFGLTRLSDKDFDARINRSTDTLRSSEIMGRLPGAVGEPAPGRSGRAAGETGRTGAAGADGRPGTGLSEDAGGIGGGEEPPIPPPPRDPGFPAPEQRRADYDRISHTDNRSWLDRLRETIERIRAGGATALRQRWQDQLASLENTEKGVYGGGLAPGRISPTMSARFAKNWRSTLEIAVNHAQVRYNRDTGIVEPIEGSKPLRQIIGQLAQEQRASGRPALDDFALWAITKRADRLTKEGRERNVPPEMIQQYRNLDELYRRDDGSNLFQQVHDELQGWHKNLLDFGEAAGLINADSRSLWEFDDYVPFYRALGADDVPAPGAGGGGIANVRSPIKHLEGGSSKINNIYENMVLNASAMIRRSMENIAAQKTRDMLLFNTDALTPMSKEARVVYGDPAVQESLRAAGLDPDALDAAARRGAAELFGSRKRRDPDVISVMDNGKANFYRVNQPLLLQSLTAAGPTTLTGVASLLAAPARLLRSAVIFDPAFMLAHNLRMAQHAYILTGTNPVSSMTAALRQAGGIDPIALRLMSAGAVSGKYDINLPRHVRATLDSPEYRNSLINTPLKAVQMLRSVSEKAMQASDIGPRIAVYNKALSDGASPAEAMDRARDLLDFSTHGAGNAAMFLAQTIPFLNARWQGMARTYRGLMGPDRNAILTRGALMQAATLALWMQNKDDPEYQRKEDWDRQYAWQIKIGDSWFRLPKPFELGALFGTVPELIADYYDNGSTRQLQNAAGSMFSNVFKFNPIPVAVKPLMEVWMNHDTYTGQAIVNEREQALEPDLRYGPTTNPSVIAATQAFNSVSPFQVAPATTQHLLQGYLAGWGTYIATAADYLGEAAGVLPARASPAEMPVVGRFLHSEPEPSNRLMDDFYELKQQVGAVGASIREADKDQDVALAQRLTAQHPEYNRGTEKEFNRIGTDLSRIRGVYQRTEMNPNLTSDQKTIARTTYFNERDKLLDSLKPFLRQAEGLPAHP